MRQSEALSFCSSGEFKPDDKTIGNAIGRKRPQVVGPRWGLVRTHTARARGPGDGERPTFVEFEPGNFPRLYQTAHSESTVDKWNNLAAEAQSAADNRPATAPKSHRAFNSNPELAAEFAKSPSGLAYFFSSNLGQLSRVRRDRC
jgi:hypothetical protein